MTPIRRAADRTFGSLQIRNYRLFVSGQLVSMTGTWMQTVALGWLVLRLTDSGVAVGINLALQFLPMLLFGLWGGLVADRFDKRRILLRTQSVMAVLAVALWALTLSDAAQLWMIYLITFLTGMTTVLDNPARQSFVTEMVGRDLVPNAVSLNSAVFNASRIIGPALAGVAIATVGLPWAFLVNAGTFVAVILALRAMDPALLHRGAAVAREAGQVRAGLRYVWSTPRLRGTVALVAVVATFGLNFSVVLPLLARFTFDRGAETFGFLTSMMASGALVGALFNAARPRPTKRWLIFSAGAFGILVTAAAMAPTLPVLAVLLVPIGAASISFIAAANTTLQLHSEPGMRGRVMALHGLVFLGSTPLGAPLVGWASQTWGPRYGLAIGGISSLVAAGVAAGAVVMKRRASESDDEGDHPDRAAGERGLLHVDLPRRAETDRLGLDAGRERCPEPSSA
ncbi:MAG: MFS transporter [Actinomycetota bacterium]